MSKSTLTAKQIYKHMLKYVKGQDEALKQLSTLIAWHVKRCQHNDLSTNEKVRIKENAFIIGPSGTGKTETFRALAELKELPCPVAVVNACNYTANGWKGDKSLSQIMEPVILKAMEKAGERDFDFSTKHKIIPLAQTAIVCIDEFDKKRMAPDLKEDYKFPEFCFQSELLKMVEGTLLTGSAESTDFEINTENILFILMGSFHELQNISYGEEKRIVFKDGFVSMEEPSKWQRSKKITDSQLIQYGLMEELVGRVPWRIQYERLHHADLIKIMAEAKHSVIKEYTTLLESTGNTLEVSEDGLYALAEESLQRGTGARAVASIFMELMRPVMFELMSRTNMHVYVGGDEVVNRDIKIRSRKSWNRLKRRSEVDSKEKENETKEIETNEIENRAKENKDNENKEDINKENINKVNENNENVSKEAASKWSVDKEKADRKMEGKRECKGDSNGDSKGDSDAINQVDKDENSEDKEYDEFRYLCESIDYTRFFDDSEFITYRVDNRDDDKKADMDTDMEPDKKSAKELDKGTDRGTDTHDDKNDNDDGNDGDDGTTKVPK